MLISNKVLDTVKPDMQGRHVSIYYLNGELLAKRFHHLGDFQSRLKLKKYEYSKNRVFKHLSVPVDILETENGFEGYIERILPGSREGELISFVDYVNAHRYDITLEEITDYVLKVCDAVDECHENGVINPDMASDGNVFYHPKKKSIYLTDYQDMQVGDIPTPAISDFIEPDPIIHTLKYQKMDIYNPNIDLYTLAIRYFYYTTKFNVPRASMCGVKIDELLSGSGIEKTAFAECLRTLYNPNRDNMDIRGPIEELSKNCVLSRFKQGEPRHFIRK